MRNFVKISMLALVAMATTASAAELEFHGYGRLETGFNSKGGSLFSFALPGSDRKFRLGNEADYVIEPGFEYKFVTLDDKSAYGVNVMPAMYRKLGAYKNGGDTIGEPLPVAFKQFYFFGNNIPQLLNGQIWAGRRYTERFATGLDDAFVENEDGEGAGIQDMDLGFAKWTVYFGQEGTASNVVKYGTHLTGIQTFSKDAALQIWGRVYAHNQVKGSAKKDTGFSLSAFHTWNLGDLGSNLIGVKYAKDTDGAEGDNHPGLGTQGYWVFVQHGINFASAKTSLEVLVKYRSTKNSKGGGPSNNSLIAGARTDTQLSGPFRFLADVGYDYDKSSASGAKATTLLKLTGALAVSGGNDPWSRPTFRLFYTQGIWNKAAEGSMGHVWINTDYSDAGVVRPEVTQFDTSTSGATYGIQAEGWW